VGEQQGREFALAVSTTGEGDVAVQAHAKSTEIRRRPRLCFEPLQSGTQSLKST
jgi:hypothetical protein